MLKIKLADLVGAYVSIEPYFSYGLTSKVFNLDGVLENGCNSDEIDLNLIDTGINIGRGGDYTNIRLSATYGHSFSDYGTEQNNRLENRILKISLAYFFE